MTFSSIIFLALFMPICLCCYFIADKKYRNMLLCLASLVFYAWNGLAFLLIIVASTTLAYFVAHWIERVQQKWKKPILILALVYNLGVLFYFKYFVAFANWILGMLDGFINVEGVNIAPVSLPLGISFYTFSVISYIVDVYWEKCKAQKNYLNVFLYILMFPKVVQGPIMRYTEFEAQVNEVIVNYKDIQAGIERFIKGLFKKVIIADQIQVIVEYSFGNVGGINTFSAWFGIIGYMLQLYYDFSGYSDMALGLGRMFGFTLPENFDHPYLSSSIPEYWRRWHISLGEWFRDYVYMPVYRSLTSKKNPFTKKKYSQLVRDIAALFVVWVLCGVWHGAGFTYLAYGMWYYLFIVIDRLRDNRKKKLKKEGKLKKDTWITAVINHVITLFAIVIGQTLFRANSLSEAFVFIKKLFVIELQLDVNVILMLSNSVIVAFILGIIFCFPIFGWFKVKLDGVIEKNKAIGVILNICWCIGLLAVYVLTFAYIAASGYSPFLYQVF